MRRQVGAMGFAQAGQSQRMVDSKGGSSSRTNRLLNFAPADAIERI
jgi:hypothetical protein